MNHIASVALLLALAGTPSAPAQPEGAASPRPAAKAADAQQPTLAQFMKIRAPGAATLAPDGTLYVRDWPDGVSQLYRRAPGADPLAPMERLTDFPDGLSSYALSPDGRTIVLAAATGGNEQTQLYLLDPRTKQITPALQNPDVVFRFNEWLKDGSGFIYTANDTSPSDFHIYRYDLQSGKSTKILGKEGSWVVAAVTADGRRLLAGRYLSASQSEVYEIDANTGELTDLTPRDERGAPVSSGPVAYLPGERKVLIGSDIEGGLHRLYVRDLDDEQGALASAVPALDQYEIDAASVNDRGDRLAVTTNEDGFGTLHVYSLPGFTPLELPEIEKGIARPVDFRGDTLVWALSNARTPGLAFATAWGARGEPETEQLTHADTQGIDLGAFTPATLIKYTSFDGLEIPAFLYLPPGCKKGTPIPFVVEFHGGPEGQHRPGFDRETQYLLSRGYGLLQPNVRGSVGYGREFHMLDNYTKRWDSVRDGVEAARWLVEEGYAEPGGIAAMGGSYGGFMAAAVPIEDARSGKPVLGASVDVVGIVNFKTFLEQTKDYRRKLREAEYGPLSDPEFLAEVSPINHIDEIQIPMFIAHGLNDPRVPVGEALQLHVGLAKRGLDPELLIFPDEGHGFAKLDNRLLYAERLVRFLEEHIGAGARGRGR